MNKPTNYAYPVGDFLSGFSDDPKNPCDYELECQRMVIRGVQYLDQHQELCDLVDKGGVKWNDEVIKPLIDFMCLNEDNPEEHNGQTGAMVAHCVRVVFPAKKMGWENYINKISNQKETFKR